MKKTLYVYLCKFSGKMRYYDRKQKATTDKQWEFIGTAEIEITPVEAKPFPKPMKCNATGLIVYFLEPERGYVLVEDGVEAL